MTLFLKKIFKPHPISISALVVFIGIFAYIFGIPFLDLVELKTVDLRFKSRGRVSPRSGVVLAVVDEKSLENEGKWMWPRSRLADLVTRLSDAGAKVIAFDMGFFEPDDKRIVETIEHIQNTLRPLDNRNRDYLEQLKAKADDDKLLANAIRNSRAKVVLGYYFQMALDYRVDENKIRVHQHNIRGSEHKLVRYTSPSAQNVAFQEARLPESNISEISDATEFSGFFNMFPDSDGVARWMPAVMKFDQGLYAPLSMMTLSAYLNSPVSVKVAEFGVEELRIGRFSVPTDELGRIMINYRGGVKTFPHIPATDILRGTVAKDVFKDKIVLIGATAAGLYDLRVTPFANVFPGVEIHANVIDSVLSDDYLFQPAWAAILDITAMMLAGLLLAMVLPRVGVIYGGLAGLSFFVGYISLCQYLFSNNGIILNQVYPLSVMVLVYVSVTAYKYMAERTQKRFIRDAFSTYLAPTVVKQLIESPEKLDLGGEERNITAFFSDVQGFTSISEKLTPHELVELLNEFLTEMTDIILSYEGTVDKFEGDAIIALFGAPNDLDNHGEVACRACVDMQKRLAELRAKWKSEGKPELKMRIGLCSGPAVVGNMGSRNRMDYTMMGDTVNTAARLEGVNKIYGVYTLISDTTYDSIHNNIVTRELDSVNVVGKKEPVAIYQVIGYQEDIDDRAAKTLGHYSNGLDLYRKRHWVEAVKHFEAALSVTPDDGPSLTMLGRCNEYKTDPPADNWDGSFTMVTK